MVGFVTGLLIFDLFIAVAVLFTGLSVYVYNRELHLAERRRLIASVGSVIILLPMLCGWYLLEIDRLEVTPWYYNFGWLLYHLFVLYGLYGFHRSLLLKLGFNSWTQPWVAWKRDARTVGSSAALYRTFVLGRTQPAGWPR